MLEKKLNYKLLVLLILSSLIFVKVASLAHGYCHDNNLIKSFLGDSKNSDDSQDCDLCEFVEFSLKLFLSLLVIETFLIRYFLKVLSYLNRLKLSFLLSSKLSTGPPKLAI